MTRPNSNHPVPQSTTFEAIREYSPCVSGWKLLTKTLSRSIGPVTFKEILDSNDLDDAIWCLRILSYKGQLAFRLQLFELIPERYRSHPSIKTAIKGINDFLIDEISPTQFHLCFIPFKDYLATPPKVSHGRLAVLVNECFKPLLPSQPGDTGSYNQLVYLSGLLTDTGVTHTSEEADDLIEALFIEHYCQAEGSR